MSNLPSNLQQTFTELQLRHPDLNKEDECAAQLLALKRWQKELLSSKENQSASLKEQLLHTQKAYQEPESWCAEQEKLLKARIVEFFHAAERKKEDCLAQAEAAFARNDFEAVHKFTLQAAESELKLPVGISLRQSLDFVIQDPNAVPRDFLDINSKKIRELVQLDRENTSIAGVNIINKITVAVGGQ